MNNNINMTAVNNKQMEEFTAKSGPGLAALVLNVLLCVVGLAAFVLGAVLLESGPVPLGVLAMVLGGAYAFLVGPILFMGVKVLRPGEAMVLTLFGRYTGTLKGEGIYFVNPFTVAVGAPVAGVAGGSLVVETTPGKGKDGEMAANRTIRPSRKLSLKTMTLDNGVQKINDQMGNPISIGIVVIWRVTNTARAVFMVDNYLDFLSIQCDSSLRNIVRLYPYDSSDDDGENEKSLRGSSVEIAENLKVAIQEKVEVAGLEILEARITHLAYAPEIAAAMLQRQQARAIVDARQLIVDGAVGMVEMALDKLREHEVVELDEERKAAMVSNLLVVLCGNKDPQPVLNSGSIY